MRRVGIAAVAVFGGLALLIAIKLAVPTVGSARAADGAPESIDIRGVLCDFRRAHPDFNVVPALGAGHYAGGVRPALDATGRPVLADGGFRVLEQWQDRADRPIAPHGFQMRGGLPGEPLGFRVDGRIELERDAAVDAFDSNVGPYGAPGNVGRPAVISTNASARRAVTIDTGAVVRGDLFVGPGSDLAEAIEEDGYVTRRRQALATVFPMPVPALPDDLEPYRELIAIDTATTLTGDLKNGDGRFAPALHCGEFRVTDDAVVTIDGDLIIRCDREFDIRRGQVVLRPDATLTVYVSRVGGGSGDLRITDHAIVNADSGDPTRVRFIAVGPGRLEVGRSHVYATIIAPERRLEVRDHGHLYGAFVGGAVKVGRYCGLHADLGIGASRPGNHGLSVRESIRVAGGSTIDSFDSTNGPYGDGNVHAAAWVTTNAGRADSVVLSDDSTIRGNLSVGPGGGGGAPGAIVSTDAGSYVSGPVGHLATAHAIPFPLPSDVGPSAGDRQLAGGEHRFAGAVRFRNLTLQDGTVVNVLGDVTIRVDETLAMSGNAEIRLEDGATLTLSVGRDLVLDRAARINANTGDPRRVAIRLTGPSSRLALSEQSVAYAWAQGAGASLDANGRSEFFGSFAGRSISLRGGSWVHVDTAWLELCLEVFDAPGRRGAEGNGDVASAESFAQWFRPVRGVNETVDHAITLTRDADGVYSYVDDRFYPLDGRLLGNEGESHNNYFTSALWARFRYEACERQFVSFEGGDGAWLFIDGRLALDLGGVRSRTRQVIDLDRFGLEPGRTYTMRLFTSQRRAGDSVFRLSTNIELMSDHTAPDVVARYE